MRLHLALAVPLAVAATVYGGVTAYFYAAQQKLVFPATVNTLKQAPDPARDGYAPLSLLTPDGATLNGIILPARPQAVPSPTLVLAFGGNAHDVSGFAIYLKNDVFKGLPVIVAGLAYRGYPAAAAASPSTGTASQNKLLADALLVHDELTRRYRPARTAAVGYSLGTSVAVWVAVHRPLAATVLVAPFASIRQLAEEEYPWLAVRPLLKHPFATDEIIGKAAAQSSVTVVYSKTDGLIPPSHVTRLVQRAQPAGLVVHHVPGATHGSIVDAPPVPALIRRAVFAGLPLPIGRAPVL